MRKTIFFLFCTVFFGAGCPNGSPKQPVIFSQRLIQYELAQYDRDVRSYQCASKGEIFNSQTNSFDGCAAGSLDPTRAKTIRDNIIRKLIRLVDYNYDTFENELYVKRATSDFLADVTELGANFAATVTNGERAKTILNAAIIAFRGGRKSADIHYFEEKTADALISSMQASRNRELAEILTQLRDKDINDYSLDAALGDVIKYFYAGTLSRALLELNQNASAAAASAKEEVRVIKGIPPSTPATQAQRDLPVMARDILKKLYDDVSAKSPPAPPSVLTTALGKLQSVTEQILSDKSITDEMNADETLKALLKKLGDDKANGASLATDIQDVLSHGFGDKTLKQATLDKIDNFLIKTAEK